MYYFFENIRPIFNAEPINRLPYCKMIDVHRTRRTNNILVLDEGINEKSKDKALFFPNLDSVVKYFEENPPVNNTIVITMGAGDIYKVADKLLKI